MKNTIYNWVESEIKSTSIDDDSNILIEVIDRLCKLGAEYHTDGVSSFADNEFIAEL